jgi:CubicO group peptidase (beta-lactamase class C family)
MWCLALALSALLIAPLALPSSSMAEIPSGLDPAVLQRNLAGVASEEMARRHLVGAVVVVVDREGVILAEGYGFADLERRTPVRPEYTTFRAASVSKLLTTTAVMQLVERGRIDLDRELAAYIPDLELPRRDGRPITPRHLLTHSAGLSEGFIGSQARTRAEWLSLRDYLGRGLPAQFAPAGDIISYANYDIGLAGLLVESVTGLPFDEAVSNEILRPLGMGRSSFGMEPAVLDGIAQGYVFVSGSQRRIPVDFRNNRASGGLVTSGIDMARFLRVFLNGGEVDGTRILRPETTTAMLTRQLSQHPGMKGIGFGFWELEIDGRSYWGHDGDVVGWNARALLMPDRGLGLFMAYTGTDTLKAFGDRVASTVFGPSQGPSARERPPRLAAAGADRLEGLYRWTRTARATPDRLFTPYWLVQYRARVDASGELELSNALGLFPTSRWEPIGVDLFQEVGGARRLSFRDEDGRITHLFLDTSPIPMAFERIAWWESVPVQATLVAFFLVAFLVISAGGLVGLLRSRPLTGMALASAADLAFLIAFPPAMGLHMFASDLLPLPEAIVPHGIPPFFYGVPPSAQLLLALPLAALAIAAVVVGRTVLSRGARSPRVSVGLIAFLLLQAGFAAFLHYWNLLGYQF